ncbi:MAG: hypothetical protein WCI18_08785 [Pseudomonadota bacterium]
MQVSSILLAVQVLFCFFPTIAIAEDSLKGERRGANHLSLGFSHSFGLKQDFNDRFTPAVFWQFHSSDGWRSGLGLDSRISGSDLEARPVLTFGQNFVYEHRLWANFYSSPGFELIWLYPTVISDRIFSRDKDRTSEVGVGLSLGIINHFSATTAIEFKLNRWRGVGTRNYQGMTSLIAISRYLGK